MLEKKETIRCALISVNPDAACQPIAYMTHNGHNVNVPVSRDMARELNCGSESAREITIEVKVRRAESKLEQVEQVERRDGTTAALQLAKSLLRCC